MYMGRGREERVVGSIVVRGRSTIEMDRKKKERKSELRGNQVIEGLVVELTFL